MKLGVFVNPRKSNVVEAFEQVRAAFEQRGWEVVLDHEGGEIIGISGVERFWDCLLYTSPSPRDQRGSRMPSSA